jgi:cobalt/nickel transport system permease protein
MLPDWLEQDNTSIPLPLRTRRGGKSFVERTIDGAASFMREAIISDSVANRRGLLQALDPRMKLVTVLALIVSVSVLRSPATIWGVYCFTLLLAIASSVPLWFFIKRVWLFIPIFSAVIVVPALFNVITPGEPLWTLFHLAHGHDFGPYHIPATIAITHQGVLTATIFIGRVAASVSLAVLMTLTTTWNNLLQALGVLRIPRIFILILAMAYRYIILLVNTVQNIHIARRSRTLRYGPTGAEQRWVASRMGYLFKRAFVMSQDVHGAMLSRGFSGDIRTLSVFKTKKYDYAWCLFIAIFCVVAFLADHRAINR